MLDDRQRTPSIRAPGLYVWSSGSNEFGWRSYLGELYQSDDVPVTWRRPAPRSSGDCHRPV